MHRNSPPTVSVLVTAYNCERFVGAAVESVLDQTYGDFEIVVVDDGSTDGTRETLETYSDPCIRLLENDRNRGVPAASNRGLEACRGEYVARLDADDLMVRTRLERQVGILESRPDLDVLASHNTVIDETGDRIGYESYPETDLELRWESLLRCPMGHPTMMFRRNLVDVHELRYDESLEVGSDYEFMGKLLRHGSAYTIQEPLVHYRWHGDNISIAQDEQQFENQVTVAMRRLEDELPEFTIARGELRRLVALFHGDTGHVAGELQRDRLVDRYLSLLDTFIDRHGGHPHLEHVRRTALFRALPRIVDEPHRLDDVRLLARAFAISPRLPLDQVKRSIDVRLPGSGQRTQYRLPGSGRRSQ